MRILIYAMIRDAQSMRNQSHGVCVCCVHIEICNDPGLFTGRCGLSLVTAKETESSSNTGYAILMRRPVFVDGCAIDRMPFLFYTSMTTPNGRYVPLSLNRHTAILGDNGHHTQMS